MPHPKLPVLVEAPEHTDVEAVRSHVTFSPRAVERVEAQVEAEISKAPAQREEPYELTSEPSKPARPVEASKRRLTQKNIRSLHSSVNVGVEEGHIDCDGDVLKALEKAAFQDVRWDNALQHIRNADAWDRTTVKQLIRKGAKGFGFWHLSDQVLDALTGHVLGEQAQVSGALQAWMGQEESCAKRSKASERLAALHKKGFAGRATMKGEHHGQHKKRGPLVCKVILCFMALLGSNIYALDVVLFKYPGILEFFSWKIYIARAAGMGALIWTAFLFLTMSRTLHRALLARLPQGNQLLYVANAHKELHVFCGKMLLGTSLLHVLAHLLGTVPGIVRHTAAELNSVLGCANPDTTRGYLDVHMPWLVWPHCPLRREFTYWEVIFMSTVGVTGVALLLVICMVGYTSRKTARSTHFDRFWYIHNIALILWPILLFVHGSNGWVGVGCPLVAFVAFPPIFGYAADRVLRLLRYYLFAGKAVAIQEAVIRPGRNGDPKGALTFLMISRPPFLWCRKFKAGMYAFLCMPEYAPAQWHPFSICSGPEDETLQFIIQGVGDWTEELARRCLEVYKPAEGQETPALPKIAIDGPYLAPTVSALSKEVLVAVGAGVGVTPFLSLLSAIITALTDDEDSIPLREAHFFWMTRNADELLFGRRLFTKIVSHPSLCNKVFLHLHVTHKEADGDVAAFLFRQAVKRQSGIDRAGFEAAASEIAKRPLADLAAVAPWSWLHGVKADLLWVSALVETPDAGVSAEVSAAHNSHWSAGAVRGNTQQTLPGEERITPVGSGFARRFRMMAKSCQHSTTKGLFTNASTTASLTSALSIPLGPTGFGAYLPVAFGRPDFLTEVRAVGKANADQDIHVYVCGNNALVASLHQVCDVCNTRAKADEMQQKYMCHFERFG